VKGWIKDDLKSDDVRAIALSLDRDEEEGLTHGTFWTLRGEIDFESFPRTMAAGERVSIPGLSLSKKKQYGLWVSFGGTEVKEFPIHGADGRFDIEVPLPDEPGVYRVAMSSRKKRRMPDSPFFFSLYVGVDPPTSYTSPLAGTDDLAVPLEDFESDVVDSINAARVAAGLEPLTPIEVRPAMRAIVSDAPKMEFARYRYYSRRLNDDPLPGEPHGLWHPTFANGRLASDAAWLALEHPISRSALLDPKVVSVAFGAADRGDIRSILLVPMEAVPDALSARDQAFADLSSRMSSKGAKEAPKLEAELSAVAAKIASGKMPFKKFFTPVRKLAKEGSLISGAVNGTALAVPPGQTGDVSDFEIPAGSRYLAVGSAVGDLGKKGGVQYTVLLVVVAKKAK
jgi:hypothetical protein